MTRISCGRFAYRVIESPSLIDAAIADAGVPGFIRLHLVQQPETPFRLNTQYIRDYNVPPPLLVNESDGPRL